MISMTYHCLPNVFLVLSCHVSSAFGESCFRPVLALLPQKLDVLLKWEDGKLLVSAHVM